MTESNGVPKVFTPDQVAKILGRSTSTVRAWIKARAMKARCVSKSLNTSLRPRYVITAESLNEFLQSEPTEAVASVSRTSRRRDDDYIKFYEE